MGDRINTIYTNGFVRHIVYPWQRTGIQLVVDNVANSPSGTAGLFWKVGHRWAFRDGKKILWEPAAPSPS
jgi:hypothetical protein